MNRLRAAAPTAQEPPEEVPSPHLRGLHNYSDTNRFGSSATRSIVRALGATVWLTETGGIVRFPPSFLDRHAPSVH